jgi:prophage DNA circulation protein
MNWIIENMKRLIDNDLVVEVIYNVIAKSEGLIANKTGKVTLTGNPSSPDFIPFNELTQTTVVTWVKSEVDVATIEAEVQAILDDKLAKKAAQTTKTGLPWGNNNIM